MTTIDVPLPSLDVKNAMRDRDAIRAQSYLKRIEKYKDNFAALNDLCYEDALVSWRWCHEVGRWADVLVFMDALSEFMHLQAYWMDALDFVPMAVAAAEMVGDRRELARWQFYQGMIDDEMGENETAVSHYQNALDLAQANNNLALAGDCHRRLGWMAQLQGDRQRAEGKYLKAVVCHKQAQDKLGQAKDLRQLGLLVQQHGDYEGAQQYLQKSAMLLVGKDRASLQLLAAVQLAESHLDLRMHRSDSARSLLDEAYRSALASEAQQTIVNIRLQQAMLAKQQEEWAEAGKIYKDILRQAKDIGYSRGEATARLELGTIAIQNAAESPHPDRANAHFAEAARQFDQALLMANTRQAGVIWSRKATLASAQGREQEEYEALNKALTIFQNLNDPKEIAGIYQLLGELARKQRKYEEATIYLEESVTIRKNFQLHYDAVFSLYYLGAVAEERGLLEEARNYYQRAYQLGKDVGFVDLDSIERRLSIVVCKTGGTL